MSPKLLFKSVDPSQLATLEHAFNAVWVVLKRKGIVATGSSQEKEQKLALVDCIVTLVEDGVTDLDELTKRAIQLMLVGRA